MPFRVTTGGTRARLSDVEDVGEVEAGNRRPGLGPRVARGLEDPHGEIPIYQQLRGGLIRVRAQIREAGELGLVDQRLRKFTN
jgi:hypothetical protein